MTHPLTDSHAVKPLRFIRRGQVVSLNNVPPSRTLLALLREDLQLTGTKEGCGEGDCGACTVVVGEAEGGRIRFRAVNSCIKLAHSVDGLALWIPEDLAAEDGTLHPAQEAMLQCHGSQCGFCTSGFVMSLFSMYQNHVCQGQPITRELAQQELSGNLCRCTGYRPILEAAQRMGDLPRARLDHADLLQKMARIATTDIGLEPDSSYQSPTTLDALLRARAAQPDAQLVAGCTDVGLWVTKQHREFAQVLDLTRVAELRRIARGAQQLSIGAAVTLSDAFAALVAERPVLQHFAARFAGLPVRNAGTLGGNVANGSPIGDSMPLLIALHAQVVLMSARGQREMPLEALYTGYRQNVMAADELLAFVKVPHAAAGEMLKVYKISKRYDDDISAVCLAINLQIDGGIVTRASIGAGGVAATPARAVRTEAALRGQPWTEATVKNAMAVLRAEFSPLTDMRASSAYRTEVLGNLLQRYWLESQGLQQINLESFTLEDAA
ncbi:MAG: xanthine dehydrogenase small subunit [Polaromonas sp.]|nr:xanthine dehydrogenase small subunit [Polaromonas sp.]